MKKFAIVWRQLKNKLRFAADADKQLLTAVGLLIIFGLVMLFSASAVVGYQEKQSAYYFFNRQLLFLACGLVLFWLFAKIDYHRWQKVALAALIFSILFLLTVFIPGLAKAVRGVKGWIEIAGVPIQPAELVKLTFLIYLSAWFAKIRQGYKPFFFLYALVAVLMLLQPDVGTLFIITVIALTVYLVGGGHLKWLISFALLGVLLLSLPLALAPAEFKPGAGKIERTLVNQKWRFLCLSNPQLDPQDKCYQLNQSLIAAGSGGFAGRGLGESRQKFLYLPEVQNDFIFAIIAEEAGFIFAALLIFVYLFIFWRGYQIARGAPDDFGRNLSIGIVTWITVQAWLNIGGVIGLLPMTGVPLPLISAGGSSLISLLLALGILTNISKQQSKKIVYER